MASGKPRVLVLGGLGFVGKYLVKYILQHDLASKVRVADKVMVAMARLTKEDEDLFTNKVECIQANLTNPDGAAKAFNDSTGGFDVVINLAAETKLSQSDGVYAEGITKLSTTVAKEAMKHKIQKFIEVSSADVYEPSSKPANESHAVKPWTGIGTASLHAEKDLLAMNGLPVVIVRPAIVYGPGDTRGLAPRICIAAVYKKTGHTMEFPSWFESQKINTVHVADVCKALWHLVQNGKVGEVYNLADKNDTDQKKLNVILEKLFGIKTGHMGLIKSEAVKLMDDETLLTEINGEHAPTWSKMILEAKLSFSPLTPWLDSEALAQKHLCIDGSAIEKTGFKYDHPTITEEEIKNQITASVQQGWFPPSLI